MNEPRCINVRWLARVCCILSVPLVANAQAPAFIYEVPEGCPTRAEFVARVSAKRDSRGATAEQLDRVLVAVRIVAGGELVVHLSFHEHYGAGRDLSAATCADAVAGAALVVALALAPEAGPPTTPSEHDEIESPSAGGVPAASPVLDEEESSNEPLVMPPSASEVIPQVGIGELQKGSNATLSAAKPQGLRARNDQMTSEERPHANDPRPWSSFQLGGSGGFNNWVAPGVVPEGRVFGQFESLDAHWALRGVGYRSLGAAELDGRSARFDVWGGRLDFSPYILGEQPGWRLALAGVLDIGSLRARGDAQSKLATANAERFWWVAPGIALRLVTPEWLRVRLELQGEALVPLRRPEFNFQRPFETVHTPAAVDFGAHAAVAVRVH